MSILIDEKTPVLIQGITGKEGLYWTQHMIDLGTNVVAGVTPKKEGQTACGVPVYDSVKNAVAKHNVEASVLFVPPKYVKDAIFETLSAGIKKAVTIADGIPLHEMAQIRSFAMEAKARVIGGNTSGVISTGKAMLGCMPYWIDRVYRPGRIGVMTRSGSLTNEVTAMIVKAGFGASTLVGVGGDGIPCTRFVELLPEYQSDPDTDAVVIIGELGGTMEEEVAEAIANKQFTKSLVAFLAGRTAPEGKRMGHAGAIAGNGMGTVKGKITALTNVGAKVAERPRFVGELLKEILG